MIAQSGGCLGAKGDTAGAEDNPEAGRLTWPLVIKFFPSCFAVVTRASVLKRSLLNFKQVTYLCAWNIHVLRLCIQIH